MSDSILAPVQILDMFLTDIQFHIEQSPASSMIMHVQEQHDVSEVQKTEDDSAYWLTMEVTVDAALSNQDDADDVRARATACVHVSVAVPAEIDRSGTDRDAYLEANALSIAYSHARSCIMALAGMSPMRSFILPAVLPYNMLDDDRADA